MGEPVCGPCREADRAYRANLDNGVARFTARARSRAYGTLRATYPDDWEEARADMVEERGFDLDEPRDVKRSYLAADQELTRRHPTEWIIHLAAARQRLRAELEGTE